MWSKDSRNSFDNEKQVERNVSIKNLQGGEILLFHDDYDSTIKILPYILRKYEINGIKTGLFL